MNDDYELRRMEKRIEQELRGVTKRYYGSQRQLAKLQHKMELLTNDPASVRELLAQTQSTGDEVNDVR